MKKVMLIGALVACLPTLTCMLQPVPIPAQTDTMMIVMPKCGVISHIRGYSWRPVTLSDIALNRSASHGHSATNLINWAGRATAVGVNATHGMSTTVLQMWLIT